MKTHLCLRDPADFRYSTRVVEASSSSPVPASDAPLLHMREISKRFPGVLANDRVSFQVHAG